MNRQNTGANDETVHDDPLRSGSVDAHHRHHTLCPSGALAWDGTLNADGTRSGGRVVELSNNIADTGMNGFHFQMFRMRGHLV